MTTSTKEELEARQKEITANTGKELVEKAATEPGAPFTPDALKFLAALKKEDRAAFETLRAQLKDAGVRVGELDEAIRPPRTASDNGNGNEMSWPDTEPWPDPVNGADLLDDIAKLLLRFLVMPTGAAEAVALWVTLTHCHDAAEHSPVLAVTSPMKRCGKSTLLELLLGLVFKALSTSNTSVAALFRGIEMWQPTVLIDEGDTFLRDNEELRGIINSGHSRGSAYVLRTVGEDHEPRRFGTWAPKALAAIRGLPDTIADRSIEIQMQRKRPDDRVERFSERRVRERLTILRRKAARWALDNIDALTDADADPELPDELHDRAQDCWRTMIAIADRAGGEWSKKSRKAAVQLSGNAMAEERGTELLSDIRDIFAKREGVDRLKSADLAHSLATMEGRPWAEWKGKPLTPNAMARLLKPFGIRPKDIRFGDKDMKGYELSEFADAFARYVPPSPEKAKPSATAATGLNSKGNSTYSSATEKNRVADEKADFANDANGVADVAVENTILGERAGSRRFRL